MLVRAEESHELWHLDDFDLAGSANVEITPGLSDVNLEPVSLDDTVNLAVGLEDFVGSSSGGGFVHPELS